MTPWQKAVIKTYAEGELEHLFDECATPRQVLRRADLIDDGVFRWLMHELSEQENCDNKDMAIYRLSTAITDIGEVLTAIRNGVGEDGQTEG
jgi:hypothetical protein